jgi:hypothetical protein
MDHRTVEQVWWGHRPQVERAISDLEAISRTRVLTDRESYQLERLIRDHSRLLAA